ncbi:MAG: hypothetical protein GX639_12800 [Fibrobacter sp.]|nr:hypothetical protein [Fibrobacter sp.]
MSLRSIIAITSIGFLALVLFTGCANVPYKKYYQLNYLPGLIADRQSDKPYPFTIRLKEFDIEEAYNRPQIVYRQSPFELRYYAYRVWAVKPSRMVTDLVYKHLLDVNLVSSVIRRYDEGSKPQYELSGMVEALEEYDSDELWFSHIALRFNLVNLRNGNIVYNRRFDLRKKVLEHNPELVIREMSALIEYAISQAIQDIDSKLAAESGITGAKPEGTSIDVIPDSLNVESPK